MGVPDAAVANYRQSQRLQAAAQLRARRLWRLLDPRFLSESWSELLAASSLEAEVSRLQVAAATAGAGFGARTLAAQGVYDAPERFVDVSAFGGFAGDGRSLGGLLYTAVPHTKRLIGGGMDVSSAMRHGGKFLGMAVKTAVADAGRQAAGVDTFARPNTGYVRMLNPPSCSRCAVLAGKFYKHNAGFLRHPRCDCTHIPTMENTGEDLRTDPYAYFESLSADGQDKAFTKAGAQAIRDGSDLFQVVNSRRGMSANGLTTAEGTSRHGFAASRLNGSARLTPEAIYAKNLPRRDTLLMLERNGYLLRGGQNPGGSIASPSPVKSTMSAAQKRVQQARLNWEAVQPGRHPQSGKKLTPSEAARYEDAYRKTLARGGEVFLPGD